MLVKWAPTRWLHGHSIRVPGHSFSVLVLLLGALSMGGVGTPRGTALLGPLDACESIPAVAAASAPTLSLPPAFSSDEAASAYQTATSQPGGWVDLTTLSWEDATTGWQRLADNGQPRLNQAFPYAPLQVNGESFPTGIGTYPFSEITYSLGGAYGALRARVALDDLAIPEARVAFSVYADEVLVYRSSQVAAGAAPFTLEAPVFGADRLRIVVESTRQSPRGAYADWLAPELFAPAGGPRALDRARDTLKQTATVKRDSRLRAASVGLLHQPRAITGDTSTLIATDGATSVWFDPTQCLVAVMNPAIEAAFGYGGNQHGRLFLARASGDLPALAGGNAEIVLADQQTLPLSQTRPVFSDPWRVEGITDPGLGSGTQLTINLQSPAGDPIRVKLTAYQQNGYLTYQIETGGKLKPHGFSYFGKTALVSVGQGPAYISDRGRIWEGAIADDGIARTVPLEPSKPFMMWSETAHQGLVLATIDSSEAPIQVRLNRLPEDQQVGLSLSTDFLPIELEQSAPTSSPRLWIEPVQVDGVYAALGDYRAVMKRLYPPSALPEWVRYQWGTWWTYGPTPTDAGIRQQVDAISQHFNDLGRWHVLIDAAWYVAYGRPNASLKNVDPDKFPDGIRATTDYAHARNIDTVLYMPAGFLHSGLPEGGEWQAFQEIIDQHPDWLTPLFDDGSISAYMLDYSVPDVREYLQSVVTDAIVNYGADGIEIDGLADPEGQITDIRTRDLHQIPTPYLPAMEIYRLLADRLYALKPDAYLEGGWLNPLLAHPYAQVFFQSDEWPTFSNPYPFGGLAEHVDYALFQWAALGQRAKVATVRGEPASRETLQWLEAALAADAQVALGFDLTTLSPQQVNALRTRLAHYDPFKGYTVTSGKAHPNAFATTRDHLSYVGIINRSGGARSFGDEVSQLGVIAPGLMAYDVERSRWIPATDLFDLQLAPKSFRLFMIAHQPRIVWTNASWSYEPSDDSMLVATLSGPAGLAGFAQIWAPDTKAVLVDGSPLRRGGSPGPGVYTLDPATGVVSLAVDFAQPHRVQVQW